MILETDKKLDKVIVYSGITAPFHCGRGDNETKMRQKNTSNHQCVNYHILVPARN